MAEEQLDGGNIGGAVRAGNTVRRAAGPWTPGLHALLAHLAARAFTGAPRPLGFDEQGREVLTFLEGETVGSGFSTEPPTSDPPGVNMITKDHQVTGIAPHW